MTGATAELAIVDLPLDALVENPWNPNRQDERVARATRESLDVYGFVEPILVRPHPTRADAFEIVGGAHRVKEARALGRATVPGVVKSLDDVAAKKLTIILNETRGEADVALLGSLLADLQRTVDPDDFLTGLPYTTGEVDHLTALADVDWDAFDRKKLVEPPPPDDLHHVTLGYGKADAERFQTWTEMLMKETGLDLATAVLSAVKTAAQNL